MTPSGRSRRVAFRSGVEAISLYFARGPVWRAAAAITSRNQRRQFHQPAVDIDLDQRRRLPGRAGRPSDAETVELHETDHALLCRLQPAKQLVQRSSADGGSLVILDCDFVVERERT